MPFAPKKGTPSLMTCRGWPDADEQMRSAWHFLRLQKQVHGPFNRSALIREAIAALLLVRDNVKAESKKAV